DEDPVGFFRTATTYYIAGTTYLWLGVSVWGPEMVRLMTTSSFHTAGQLIPTAALIPYAFGVRAMLGTGRELTDNTRPLPLVAFFGLIAVIASAYLFIGPLGWGANGAALSTVTGWAVMGAGAYWFAQRVFPIDYQWPQITAFFAIALALVFVFYRYAVDGS